MSSWNLEVTTAIFILVLLVQNSTWLQRFGNISGLFQVMSVAIRSLDEKDIDSTYMTKLAKIASAEMISSKVHELLIKLSILCLCFSWRSLVVSSVYLNSYFILYLLEHSVGDFPYSLGIVRVIFNFSMKESNVDD